MLFIYSNNKCFCREKYIILNIKLLNHNSVDIYEIVSFMFTVDSVVIKINFYEIVIVFGKSRVLMG